MKPSYICINGHTFDEPLVGEKLGISYGYPTYACPMCYTMIFKQYSLPDELKDLKSKAKTVVTKPGRVIKGSTMVHFECDLCSCEFESPISECALAVVYYKHDIPVVRHKCPNKFCGVECQASIDNLCIFGDKNELAEDG